MTPSFYFSPLVVFPLAGVSPTDGPFPSPRAPTVDRQEEEHILTTAVSYADPSASCRQTKGLYTCMWSGKRQAGTQMPWLPPEKQFLSVLLRWLGEHPGP